MKIMKLARVGWLRVWFAGGSLFLLGDCGLSDQQLTSVAQSAISTGLNTVVSSLVSALVDAATAANGG